MLSKAASAYSRAYTYTETIKYKYSLFSLVYQQIILLKSKNPERKCVEKIQLKYMLLQFCVFIQTSESVDSFDQRCRYAVVIQDYTHIIRG